MVALTMTRELLISGWPIKCLSVSVMTCEGSVVGKVASQFFMGSRAPIEEGFASHSPLSTVPEPHDSTQSVFQP